MTIFTHTHSVKEEELVEITSARTNSLISEYEVSSGTFGLVEVPFEQYKRTVEVKNAETRTRFWTWE